MRTVKSGQLLWGKSGKQDLYSESMHQRMRPDGKCDCWLSLSCEGWSSAPIVFSDCPRCSQSLCSANSICWLAVKGHGTEQDPSSHYCVSVRMCATARGWMPESGFVERVLVSTLMCGKTLSSKPSMYCGFSRPVF